MLNKNTRLGLFFLLVFLSSFLLLNDHVWGIEFFSKFSNQLQVSHSNLLLSLVFTGFIVGVFYLARISTCSANENYKKNMNPANRVKETFWDITPSATCKGGAYMWQGNSEHAKMCRAMASTPEGKCAIASYNCPTGYIGTPSLPFVYTPLSGDNFENERCQNKGDCNSCPYTEESTKEMVAESGTKYSPMTSFEKSVY